MSSSPPGWYPCPSGTRGQLRFFDGTSWTHDVKAAGSQQNAAAQAGATSTQAGNWTTVDDSVLTPPVSPAPNVAAPASAPPAAERDDDGIPRWAKQLAARQQYRAEHHHDDSDNEREPADTTTAVAAPRAPRRNPKDLWFDLLARIDEHADVNKLARIVVTALLAVSVLAAGVIAGRPGPAPLTVLPTSFATVTAAQLTPAELSCIGAELADNGVDDNPWTAASVDDQADTWAAAQTCVERAVFTSLTADTTALPLNDYDRDCLADALFDQLDTDTLVAGSVERSAWTQPPLDTAFDAALRSCRLDASTLLYRAASAADAGVSTASCVSADVDNADVIAFIAARDELEPLPAFKKLTPACF